MVATGALAAFAGFAWRFALYPKLVLTGDEVVVVNPWATTRLPLHDVVGLSGGSTGARLQRRDGWAVRVFALADVYGGGPSQRPRVEAAAAAIRAAQRPGARG